MTTTVKEVKITAQNNDIFFEGNLVRSIQTGEVFLVTVPATGYSKEEESKDCFWAIPLTGSFISGGGYLKSLFRQFVGTITLEGKY